MSLARTIAAAARAARRDAAPDPSERRAPGPPSTSLLGNFQEMRRSRIPFLVGATERYGDVVRLRFGPMVAHVFRHPDHVKHVLVDRQANYTKQTRGFDELRTLLGNGLLTSEGSFWLRQRRIAQPGFHRQRIAGFAEVMVRATEAMLERWAGACARGEVLDVSTEMMRLTLRVVGETLLGTDVTANADEVGPAVSYLLENANARMMSIVQLPESVPTPAHRRVRDAKATLDRVVLGMIEKRRRDGNADKHDLLAMLMEARDEETGESMDDRQLRDEVMTMFLAGHETTANALTWTFYLLSQHPPSRRALHDELLRVLPGGRAPTLADLPALEYTRRVLDEGMRLYPPAWIIGRMCTEADVVGGYDIPAGSLVFVSPYITHRHPDIFADPEGFDPDRFAPERAAALPRYAYFPFGGGPRQCIGNTFALMEAQLMLATIARKYRLELVPGHRVEMEPVITLRPRYGMKMRVRTAS